MNTSVDSDLHAESIAAAILQRAIPRVHAAFDRSAGSSGNDSSVPHYGSTSAIGSVIGSEFAKRDKSRVGVVVAG